jgi:hypothetical protein
MIIIIGEEKAEKEKDEERERAKLGTMKELVERDTEKER